MRDVSDCTDFRFFRAFVLLGGALDGDDCVTTKVARLETTKTRSHKGTKKRKSFEMLGVLSVFAPLW